jgi:predicted SnoaL-like aldol condensation-catalyzing enzyme
MPKETNFIALIDDGRLVRLISNQPLAFDTEEDREEVVGVFQDFFDITAEEIKREHWICQLYSEAEFKENIARLDENTFKLPI